MLDSKVWIYGLTRANDFERGAWQTWLLVENKICTIYVVWCSQLDLVSGLVGVQRGIFTDFFAGLITIPVHTSRVCRIMYLNPARPLYIIISKKVNVNLFEKTQCTRNAYFYIVDTCKESYKSIHTLIPQNRQETNLLQISEIINHLNYIRWYTYISHSRGKLVVVCLSVLSNWNLLIKRGMVSGYF